MTDTATSFAGLLKHLRISAGLTQEGLAQAAGLSYRSISDLERGINLTARRETARLLADALGLEGAQRANFDAVARGRTPAARMHPNQQAAQTHGESSSASSIQALPRDISTFTGRSDELARLAALLDAPAGPEGSVFAIHAIDGMAGIGKTTFAVRVGHQLAPQFPDGQIFLRLHGHTPGQRPVSATDALATLLLTIGVSAQHIPADTEARAALWRGRMSSKKALLVLDDAIGTDQIRPLLPSGADTLVLITSRRRLSGLPEAQPLTLDILDPDEAAALLVRLVARSDVEASDTGVIRLVRWCGYLPLAISLMAGQLKHHGSWTADDLANDLASARDRLATIHAEEYSVAAAFDLSYADLDAEHQLLFGRLGLQPGSDIDAYAAAALGDSSLDIAAAQLEDLYTHHLIDEPARGRYRFHDLIREHARLVGKTEDAAHQEAAIERLLGYYAFTARNADRHLARRTPIRFPLAKYEQPMTIPHFDSHRDAATWMEAERLNLHAAVDFSVVNGRSLFAIAIPAVMHGFLRTNGYWSQAETLHRSAIQAASATKDSSGEAAALVNLGDMQYLTGDYTEANNSLTRAADQFRLLGNKLGEANSISILGLVQRATGNHRTAVQSQGHAVALYQSVSDLRGEANSMSDLGFDQYLIGNYNDALSSLAQALQINSGLGDENGQATTLNLLGIVRGAMGDFSAAVADITRSLALYRATGTPWGEANALVAIGDAQRLIQENSKAFQNLIDALAIYRDLGHRSGQAQTLNSLGELALARNDLEVSLDYHTSAIEIAQRITAPLEEGRALEGIGRYHVAGGRVAQGTSALNLALAIYQRLSSPRAIRVQQVLDELLDSPV